MCLCLPTKSLQEDTLHFFSTRPSFLYLSNENEVSKAFYISEMPTRTYMKIEDLEYSIKYNKILGCFKGSPFLDMTFSTEKGLQHVKITQTFYQHTDKSHGKLIDCTGRIIDTNQHITFTLRTQHSEQHTLFH